METTVKKKQTKLSSKPVAKKKAVAEMKKHVKPRGLAGILKGKLTLNGTFEDVFNLY